MHTLVQDATAAGGGIFTHGSLMLDHSTLGFNGAFSTGSSSLFGNYGEGGGAYAVAGATITYSTIRNNGAYGVTVNGFGGSRGAGMYIKGGTVKVQNSTIYGNRASHRDGGMTIVNADVTVINSTISGNWAKGGTSGGMRCTNCTAKIYNSTIAFNKAAFGYAAAGLVVYNSSASTVKLQGVLLAENSVDADGSQYDWLSMGNSVIGSNNLIHATGSPVPSGTLTGVAGCPLLGPLRDNGGPTWTHALLSGSPGIDAGTVPPGNDQRGAPFVRVSGTKADIGAYEVQKADIVYNSAFDGCT